jgi:hypothetical protein
MGRHDSINHTFPFCYTPLQIFIKNPIKTKNLTKMSLTLLGAEKG